MPRQSCILCCSIPTNILTLQCNHSLCTSCASRVCNMVTHNIICPSCRVTTYLHEDIIDQLSGIELYQDCQQEHNLRSGKQQLQIQRSSSKQAYRNSQQLSKTKPIGYNKQNSYELNHQPRYTSNKSNSYYEKQAESNGTVNKLKKRKQKQKQKQKSYHHEEDIQQDNYRLLPQTLHCKQHIEYQIMYICMDCNNCFICPQCVIHGQHKNHQVQTIKKTITKIHAEVSSKVYSLDCSIEGLIKASQDKKISLKCKIQQINRLKQEAASKYRLMREQLAKEQKDIIDKCAQLIGCFQRDYSQIQQWIKNDLSLIEKQKNNIHSILNPINQSKSGNKQGKQIKKLTKSAQVKIVQQYFNYLKRNQKNRSKKFMWINNKSNQGQLHQEIQQNLQVLTDRIQKIKPYMFRQMSALNNIETKQNSLAASRQKQKNANNLRTDSQKKQISHSKLYFQSPFNSLKATFDKQSMPSDPAASKFGSKASYIKQSRMVRKPSINFDDQNNFLIF